tara:strand:- start:87 stop:191 length:105 start_codon:yes stop_codon:yes gene_type:complete
MKVLKVIPLPLIKVLKVISLYVLIFGVIIFSIGF